MRDQYLLKVIYANENVTKISFNIDIQPDIINLVKVYPVAGPTNLTFTGAALTGTEKDG